MLEAVIIGLLLIVLLYLVVGRGPEKFKTGQLGTAVGEINSVRLYEDFHWTDTLFEFVGNRADGEIKHMKYAIRAPVKSIDINMPIGSPTEDRHVELWNVRDGKPTASSTADFYENNIYTTPDYLRNVTGNLTLLARVRSGERLRINDLDPTKKVLIVARI